MSIDRGILYRRLETSVGEKYSAPDRDCTAKGRRGDRDGLPADKSLFHSRPGSAPTST